MAISPFLSLSICPLSFFFQTGARTYPPLHAPYWHGRESPGGIVLYFPILLECGMWDVGCWMLIKVWDRDIPWYTALLMMLKHLCCYIVMTDQLASFIHLINLIWTLHSISPAHLVLSLLCWQQFIWFFITWIPFYMIQIMINRVTRREAFGKYLAEQVNRKMYNLSILEYHTWSRALGRCREVFIITLS